MTTRPVRAVVVAFNGADDVDRCLSSLGNAIDATVVDNSSSEQVRDAAGAHGARYVDAGGNRGFAAGVNIALREILGGEPVDVLLVNPDARVDAHTVAELAGFLRRPDHDQVAAVAPRLIDDVGAEQRAVWPYPSPLRAWLQAAGLGDLRTRNQFLIGAVLLLRWEALCEVGVFDERFFLYAEEADWQLRATRLNWTSELLSAAVAGHSGAGASDDPQRQETLFHAGQETYIRKWHGDLGWAVYSAAVITGAGIRAVILRGERRAEARRRAWLYLRGPRRSARLRFGI